VLPARKRSEFGVSGVWLDLKIIEIKEDLAQRRGLWGARRGGILAFLEGSKRIKKLEEGHDMSEYSFS